MSSAVASATKPPPTVDYPRLQGHALFGQASRFKLVLVLSGQIFRYEAESVRLLCPASLYLMPQTYVARLDSA